MNKVIKNSIAIVLIVLATLSIIFGSYLPLVKSQRYVSGARSLSSINTIDQFKQTFDRSLRFYSPVGDEEVVKFLGSDILQIIAQGNQSEAVSRALFEYIEPYLFKNDVRHLLIGAESYNNLWRQFGKEEDFEKSENYFKNAYKIGSKLPPVLYGMLNLYVLKGDKEKAKEIGEIIVNYWPDDEKVKEAVKVLSF